MSETPVKMHAIDAIEASVAPFAWRFAQERRTDIETHWRNLTALKPALFDGRVLLLSRAEFIHDKGRRLLRSAHFETDFSAFLAWRDFGFPDETVQNCFAMAALRGNDGGFILGQMGAHTANAGQIYFPAGTPDRNDIVDGRLDLAGSVARELEEETGLKAHEAAFADDWFVLDAGPRLGCMKLVTVDAPADEVARDLNARIASQKDAELTGVCVIRNAREIDPERMPAFVVAYLDAMLDA